jgi:cell division protease FtsH
MDAEIRRLVDDCYGLALEQLRAHREQLDRLAAALLEGETLDEGEAYAVAGISRELVEPLPEPA